MPSSLQRFLAELESAAEDRTRAQRDGLRVGGKKGKSRRENRNKRGTMMISNWASQRSGLPRSCCAGQMKLSQVVLGHKNKGSFLGTILKPHITALGAAALWCCARILQWQPGSNLSALLRSILSFSLSLSPSPSPSPPPSHGSLFSQLRDR
ncbi:uncharacterized protein BCR38DRAFT_8025 [Pseudomassariella vexata]|uniref:Uncharacterized protein n=1 Tax=Pseudomassariella vexata TaxID=1141098 RepID=A0A1Y2EJA4_9PEZI|nr:uncharacterized protein BCR38DRAFT_8025 [Pseudomassariella vexata]ORY71326.1 hypothetical protein BCR38DRAFT_8025 [Pseudomassariella vexata]